VLSLRVTRKGSFRPAGEPAIHPEGKIEIMFVHVGQLGSAFKVPRGSALAGNGGFCVGSKERGGCIDAPELFLCGGNEGVGDAGIGKGGAGKARQGDDAIDAVLVLAELLEAEIVLYDEVDSRILIRAKSLLRRRARRAVIR
jgi:hypothetical protein